MLPTSQFPADLVTFTEEIFNGKLHFFCAVQHLLMHLLELNIPAFLVFRRFIKIFFQAFMVLVDF